METPGQDATVRSSPSGDSTEFTKNNELFAELESQTDRGCAVLAGAFLESMIRRAIRSRLVVWDLPREKGKPLPMGAKLVGTDAKAGELGFLDQCRLAYCQGAIGPGAYRDLERIAQIRNLFAHHGDIRSFSNQAVAKLCDELEAIAPFNDFMHRAAKLPATATMCPITDPRKRFVAAVFALFMLINRTKAEITDYCPEPGHIPGDAYSIADW